MSIVDGYRLVRSAERVKAISTAIVYAKERLDDAREADPDLAPDLAPEFNAILVDLTEAMGHVEAAMQVISTKAELLA